MEIKRILSIIFSLFLLPVFLVFGEDDRKIKAETVSTEIQEEMVNAYSAEGEILPVTKTEYDSVVSQDRDYFVKTGADGKQVIFQRLEWEPVEFSKGYIFKLEKQIGDGVYTPIRDFELTENFILLALEAGSYRYSVQVLNFFGKVQFESDYVQFTLIKALKPELKSVSPEIIYLDEPYDGIYTVTGENILENSEIFLGGLGKRIKPVDLKITDKNGKRAVVTFAPEDLNTGTYDFFIRNPGGFYSSKKIDIKYFKWYDLDITYNYAPFFVLSDDTLKTYINTDKSFTGSQVKLTFMPVKRRREYFGFSLSGFYHYLYGSLPGYTGSAHIVQAYCNFVYQCPIIRKRFILDVHGGAGVLGFLNLKIKYPHNFVSDSFNSLHFSVDAGMSFNIYVMNRLFLELGSDFVYSIVGNGCIIGALPYIGVGWQF